MAQVWGWPSAWLLTSQVRRADCTSPAAPGAGQKSVGAHRPHPPLTLSRAPAPQLTCVSPLLAVAEALQGALGPGLGAHACGEAHVSSSGDLTLNPGLVREERLQARPE